MSETTSTNAEFPPSPPRERRHAAWRSALSQAWNACVWAGSRVGRGVLHLTLPPICLVCQQSMDEEIGDATLCAACREFYLRPGSSCVRCGHYGVQQYLPNGRCMACRDDEIDFDGLVTLGPYQKELRQAILSIKQASGESLAMALGKMLAQQLRPQSWLAHVDLVVGVPMYWLKRLWRGANAAETIARVVAGELRIPLADDLVVCRRWLKKQGTLTRTERLENVRGAFASSRAYDIRDARILVVDDVVTTCATASAVCRALKSAGAAQVYVGGVARGMGT